MTQTILNLMATGHYGVREAIAAARLARHWQRFLNQRITYSQYCYIRSHYLNV